MLIAGLRPRCLGLRDCILDGELCYLDAAGQPTLSGLRAAIGRGETDALVFFVFDMLWRDQGDLRRFALKDRKEILAGMVAPAVGKGVRLVETVTYRAFSTS